MWHMFPTSTTNSPSNSSLSEWSKPRRDCLYMLLLITQMLPWQGHNINAHHRPRTKKAFTSRTLPPPNFLWHIFTTAGPKPLWRILPFVRKMFLLRRGKVLPCLFLGSIHTPMSAAQPVIILWKKMMLSKVLGPWVSKASDVTWCVTRWRGPTWPYVAVGPEVPMTFH